MKTRLSISIAIILSIAFILGWAPQSRAQGIIIDPILIDPWHPQPIGPYPAQPITLQSQSIEVNIEGQFAHVRSTQIFKNNTWMDLEGTWVFPVPHGADISDFSLWLDGKELTAETMEAAQAAQIYHQIVATMRDPGLLEYLGEGLIQAHIYPIPANGTKQVDMEYDWLLPLDSGLMRVDLPLKLDGYSIDVINSLAITVNIKTPDALGTIYSPTHDVKVDRESPYEATASMEKSSIRPQGDFVLYISRPKAPVGLNMLTHGTGTNEGYFLAMIAPEYDESSINIVPKDFVCVLDTSGSMAGGKIEQAKEALDFIFRNLNDDDRFALITFATDVYPYFDGWSDATGGNISDVRDYISGIDAGGSTNINSALDKALSYESGKNRPMYVIFLTDGLPTVGETNTAKIIENTNAVNSEVDGRIFCFGVGDDVDYSFIDRLSRENGGYTSNVAPDEDLEQPLSDFYSKIKSPVMTGIEVEIRGARIYDMLPVNLSDLFLGSQILLTGRYVGSGSGEIILTGSVSGDSRRYSYDVEFTDERDNDFIPRHWATRRVGYLLNQVRLYGENTELKDEIVELAMRYGIITPYTSMLVVEDEMMDHWAWQDAPEFMTRDGGTVSGSVGAGGLGGGGSNAASPPSAAREQSESYMKMESGEAYDMEESLVGSVSYAGDKTFYLNNDGYWVDSEYDEDIYGEDVYDEDDIIKIVYLSDEYFDLLTDEPDIAEYLTVGDAIILIFNDTVYQIDPE